jgi:spore maturation protein CgeB
MYREGVEAVFWSDAQECANLCRQLLADEPRRAAIAQAGQRRVHANQHFHEPMLRALLAELAQPLNVAVATA